MLPGLLSTGVSMFSSNSKPATASDLVCWTGPEIETAEHKSGLRPALECSLFVPVVRSLQPLSGKKTGMPMLDSYPGSGESFNGPEI